jgi:hypothetical protein
MNLDRNEIKAAIRAKVVDLAKGLDLDASGVADDDVLPATGLLDSNAILELVVWFETSYKFSIKQEEINIDNLLINAMTDFLIAQKVTHLPTLEPIRDADLPEFCAFLVEHLSSERTPEQWAQAFRQDWGLDKPNNGFLIRDQGKVVGGIGALYAQRLVRGQSERFCNITSWCVLEPYRAQSMRLAMAVVSQPGFHFTDLTPTEVVSKTLQFLKFKPMNERQAVWPNFRGRLHGSTAFA